MVALALLGQGFFNDMKLLRFNNYQVELEPYLLTFPVFKKIWKRDRDRTKQNALNELTFIYFYTDLRSEYAYITDDEVREKTITKDLGLNNFKIDEVIQQAINLYKELLKTPSSRLLESAIKAVDKLSKFLDEVDFKATDDKGRPLYPINTVTSAIKQMPQLAQDLIEMQKKVAKEIEESDRVRGGTENLKIFEDGVE